MSEVPKDYDSIIRSYAACGFRVLACAARNVHKMNWAKLQKLPRSQAETDLTLLGLIVFENKVKPATVGVIAELAEAKISTMICTGDNLYTAISVARECNIISDSVPCLLPSFVEGK